MRSPVALALLGIAVLAACTTTAPSPEPSPTPPTPVTPTPAAPTSTPATRGGGYLGVVLSPSGDADDEPTGISPLAAALQAAAEDLTGAEGLGIERVRVLQPPSESFREDEMGFLARDGADLVCTLGNATDLVARLAPRHPDTAFCLLDAVLQSPSENVTSVGWDDEGIAFLSGAATALAAGEDNVGLVAVGEDAITTVERRRDAFDAGARHVRPGVRIRALAVPLDEDDDEREAARAATSSLLAPDGGRTGALTAVGDLSALAGVAEAAESSEAVLVGWGTDLAEHLVDEPSGRVAASVVKRVDIALVTAIRRVREGAWEPLVLGPGDDAVTIAEGPAPVPGLVTRVRRLAADLAAGAVQIPPQQPGPG